MARTKVVIQAGQPTTTQLKLEGPIEFDDGRALAAKLNGIVAHFNTLFFKRPDGTSITPKITAVSKTN